MLGQRVITAIVLLVVLLPALFHPNAVYFNFLVLILVGAAGWEWGRLNNASKVGAVGWGIFCLLVCATAWFGGAVDRRQSFTGLWVVVSAFWIVGGAILLRGGLPLWRAIPQAIRLGIGPVALFAVWLSVAQAKLSGVNFLLSIFLLVWVADIFAYFSGKAFGGRIFKNKLAPTISPGKSWEGVWGGMIGVLVMSQIWRWFDSNHGVDNPSLFSVLFEKGWVAYPFLIILLAAMSVVGDLVESLIKRSAGAKDSSRLLPGHGGVLDRVDALLPVFPLAILLCSI